MSMVVHGCPRVTVQAEREAPAQRVLDAFAIERRYQRFELGDEVERHEANLPAPVRAHSLSHARGSL